MKRMSLEKVVFGQRNRHKCSSRMELLSQQIPLSGCHDHVPIPAFFPPRKNITWFITTFFITLLLLCAQVCGNPLLKQGQTVSGNNNKGSPSFYYSANSPNRFIPSSINVNSDSNNYTNISENLESPSSTLTSTKDHEQALVSPSKTTFGLNDFCEADVSLEEVTCRDLQKREDLPKKQKVFDGFQRALFVNISGSGIRLEHIKALFPNLIVLGITESPVNAANLINLRATSTQSRWGLRDNMAPKSLLQDPHFARRLGLSQLNSLKPTLTSLVSGGSGGIRGQRALIADTSTTTSTIKPTISSGSSRPWGNGLEDSHETNDIPLDDVPVAQEKQEKAEESHYENVQMDAAVGVNDRLPEPPGKLKRLAWPSVRHLNLSWNQLKSEDLPQFLDDMFPNLEQIDLSNNFLIRLEKIEKAAWTRLKTIDISANPLDCIKLNLDWIDGGKVTLLHPNETICDQPPHQNKPKPIFKVIPLIKKMREKCKELKNCTCDIDYIYEKDHVIHAMTVVNCSGKGFLDFPDPAHLPQPTTTLDLRNNKISSLATFVDNQEYLKLNVTNLYLDDNQISSINILEGSEWFYDFQVFSIRRNNLTEVPVYVLENVFRQNERLVQFDLSSNKFKCDCFTVSSFKVWLLKYASHIGNVDDVRCASTKEQIRYMRMEEWCTMDNGAQLIDVLDLVSIVLAILIVVVIAKVYYDYWNFKTKGKLPWIVSKM